MRSSLIISSVVLSLITGFSRADEPLDAGKATFERVCEECHYEDDFAGKTRQDILSRIEQVAGGDIEHERDLSGLSEGELVGLAAFFASFD